MPAIDRPLSDRRYLASCRGHSSQTACDPDYGNYTRTVCHKVIPKDLSDIA